jgi:hypothetical protein
MWMLDSRTNLGSPILKDQDIVNLWPSTKSGGSICPEINNFGCSSNAK